MSESAKPSRKRLNENRIEEKGFEREGEVGLIDYKEMPKAPPEVLAKLKMFKLNRRNAITADSPSAPNPFAAIKAIPKPAATGFGNLLAPHFTDPSPASSSFSFSSKSAEALEATKAVFTANGCGSGSGVTVNGGSFIPPKFNFNFSIPKPEATAPSSSSSSSQEKESKELPREASKFGSFGFSNNSNDGKEKCSSLGDFKFNFSAATANIGTVLLQSPSSSAFDGESNGKEKNDADNSSSKENDGQGGTKVFAEGLRAKANDLASAPVIAEHKAGDEEDEVLITLRNSKVYRVGEDKKWRERGQGDVKVLMHKGNKPMIVMYSSATFHLLLQVSIDKGFSVGKVTEKSVTLRSVEDDHGKIKPQLYLIKISDDGKEESIQAFVEKLRELSPK